MNRYARQEILPELGVEGQARLKAASVLCIGAGGLGAPALLYLAAAGIGRIGIIDDDRVDLSNLQRQVLFNEGNQGEAKVQAAAAALTALNHECGIELYQERFTAANAEQLLRRYEVILDGTDNFSSKFLINDACVKYGRPLVYGSILGFDAQVAVFDAAQGPCYRCLYPKPPESYVPNCAEAGVIGAMAGIAGSVQALEALKLALGTEWCRSKGLQPLLGRLWLLDAKRMETRSLAVPKRKDCPVCSVAPESIRLEETPQLCTDVPSLTATEAAKLHKAALFLDVREERELVSGRIPGSLHLPLEELLTHPHALNGLAKDTPIIVYCQHGIRSHTGAQYLREHGYGNVTHLAGGLARWGGERAA